MKQIEITPPRPTADYSAWNSRYRARKAERERENASKGAGGGEISFHSNNAPRSLGERERTIIMSKCRISLSGSLKQTAAEAAAAAIKAKTHLPSVTSSRWGGDYKRETDTECSAVWSTGLRTGRRSSDRRNLRKNYQSI